MINPILPVYFVIVEPVSTAQTRMVQMQVLTLLNVVEGDLSDYSDVYDSYVAPLTAMGRNVYYYVFLREPNNPFGQKALFDMIKAFIQHEES